MAKTEVNISCPGCGTAIDVDEILYHQLQYDIEKQYKTKFASMRSDFEEKEERLKAYHLKLQSKEKEIYRQVEDQVAKQVLVERQAMLPRIKQQIADETADRLLTLQNELSAKSEKLKEFNQALAQIEKLKREKDEMRAEVELEAQKKINAVLSEERQKLSRTIQEKADLKISEKEKIIDQLKDQLQEAQRKADQGSMQLQGEVLELAIEKWLRTHFPLDEITEVKKGARGADCIQVVNTRSARDCGTIYYESKRTKEFSPSWIEKFKADMRDKGADIGVIVTEAMPKDMDRMGLKDGIWICTFSEFKGLCLVLRQNIIRMHEAISSQENKGDKMVMLYNYLTSNEFKLQNEGIVEGFSQMQIELDSEKRSIMGHWKKREKQIQKVILNTNYMYSSIKGIAGNAIKSISALELTEPEDDNVEEKKPKVEEETLF